MKKILVNTIWAVGGIALALFCLSACTRELDVQQAYDFSLEVMPVQNSIAKGETAEIRCSLKRSGRFANTQYTIRYFQPDGKGCLKMDDGTVFKPNETDIRSRKISSVSIILRSPQTARRLTCMWRTIMEGCNN